MFENKIQFQFPLHEVVVTVAHPEACLAEVFSGQTSLFSVNGSYGKHLHAENVQILNKEFYR